MALVSGATLAAAVLLLVILYHVSNVFRFYTKCAVFVLLSVVSATAFIPLMLLRPRDYRNALLPAWGARQISKLLGLRWEMRGLDNVVQDTGCVVLINHQSALDLLVLAELWPRLQRCTVISKKEVFYLWPFGLACWLWGTIFIDRLNGDKARSTMDSTADIIKHKKAKLCMFPEGTRNSSSTLLPFKKGAFHVAIASQTPIQPVVVSRYYFLDSRKKIFNTGYSIISILPAISTKGLTRDNLEQLVMDTHSIMAAEHSRVTEEAVGTHALANKKSD